MPDDPLLVSLEGGRSARLLVRGGKVSSGQKLEVRANIPGLGPQKAALRKIHTPHAGDKSICRIESVLMYLLSKYKSFEMITYFRSHKGAEEQILLVRVNSGGWSQVDASGSQLQIWPNLHSSPPITLTSNNPASKNPASNNPCNPKSHPPPSSTLEFPKQKNLSLNPPSTLKGTSISSK